MDSADASQRALPGLKQFRHEGCISHIVYDPRAREALLIDPRADLMEDYRGFLAEHRLKPVAVVDTRLHWHHLSGSHFFAETYRVPVVMSARTQSARATRKLPHGDRLKVGSLEFQVLETPGVSPDAICLYGEGLIFTGDTVTVASGARTDLPGGDSSRLWESLRQGLASLPGKTIVLPGHDLQDLLFSTLDIERRRNPDWVAARAREDFVRAKAEERAPRGDGDVRKRLDYNLSAHPTATAESHFGSSPAGLGMGGEGGGVASISVEKCALKVKERAAGTCFLDVREPEEFRGGHLPGAINIPLSELALHLGELMAFKRIYVCCQSGRRSSLAAKTLDYLKLPDIVNISGGFKAWENAGLPVE